MSVTFIWKGNEYQKKLKKGAVKGLTRSTTVVHSNAVAIVPKISRTLEGSINKAVDPVKMIGKVFTNCEYAPEVEFKRRHMAGHPFLRPSLMDNIDKIKRIFIDEERKAIAN